MPETYEEKAHQFLKNSKLYMLGDLETEKPHPETAELSYWAVNDLNTAIAKMVSVDVHALQVLVTKIPHILELRNTITQVLKSKGKIFLCGCGATGRLSLTLEYLWREQNPTSDKVRAFMAGGDVALVHSLEGFEDFPEYGAEHLMQLGFSHHDLLISCTEGGETPYVIGATLKAAEISRHKPYFLYCNPDEILMKTVERSKKIIQDNRITKINLTVGPMALSGSTRMQASTVLQLAVGYALLTHYNEKEIEASINKLILDLKQQSAYFLPPFIKLESDIYKKGDFVIYSVKDVAITVYTDTTERSPTFSLSPFSHRKSQVLSKKPPSLCYIMLPEAQTANEAWDLLLNRHPHCLNWPKRDLRTTPEYMASFNFGVDAKMFRDELTPKNTNHIFEIFHRKVSAQREELVWKLAGHESHIVLNPGLNHLEIHTLLKMFLNIHSTLVMGRLGRFEKNVMTWVYPSNGKLIDRAARYVLWLLKARGIEPTYVDVVKKIFYLMETIPSNQSLVLKACESFLDHKLSQ